MKNLRISSSFVKTAAITLAFVCLSLSTASAAYQAPDLSKPLLERGKLALDADALEKLSKNLLSLQGAENNWSPKVQRTHAQIVALSNFLAPANTGASELNQVLAKGQKPTAKEERERIASINQIWQVVRWLSTEEAGKASNELSLYILDIMVEVDPDHPLAAKHDRNTAFGRWKAVVAPLRDFQDSKDDGEPSDEGDSNPFTEDSEPEPEVAKKPTTAAPRAKGPVIIHGAGYLYDSKGIKAYPSVITFKITGQGKPNDKGNWDMNLSPNPGDKAKRNFEHVRNVLFKRYRREGKARVTASTKFKLSQSSHTTDASQLPLILGLEGLVLNQQPLENLIALGQVSGDQKVSGANSWWYSIDGLRDKTEGEPRILLVPEDIAEDFINIIALGEPEFFTKYECIQVKDVDEACRYAFGELPEGTQKAMKLFDEIQEIAKTKRITILATNRFVRAKLKAAYEADPNFLSAKMLLIQGGGRRPSKIDRKTLALELRRICYRISSALSEDDSWKLRRGDRLMKTFDSCREITDELERYVDTDDRALYSEGVDVINYLRTIDREIRLAGRDDKNRDPAKGTIRKVKNDLKRLEDKIRTALGEEDPDKIIIPK